MFKDCVSVVFFFFREDLPFGTSDFLIGDIRTNLFLFNALSWPTPMCKYLITRYSSSAIINKKRKIMASANTSPPL